MENTERVVTERRPRNDYKGRSVMWRTIAGGMILVCALLQWFLLSAIHANHDLTLQLQSYHDNIPPTVIEPSGRIHKGNEK